MNALEWWATVGQQEEFEALMDGIEPGIEKAVEEAEYRRDCEREEELIRSEK